MGNVRNQRILLIVICSLSWTNAASSASTCSSPAIEAYSDLGILCYWVDLDLQSAADAAVSCTSQGGYLAEIPDTAVLQTLTAGLTANYPAITYTSKLHFGYIMKSPSDIESRRPPNLKPNFVTWGTGEPSYNNLTNYCIAINNGGEWFAVDCEISMSALCFNITDPACPLLDPPPNGSVTYTSTNATAIFQCDHGYTKTSGDERLLCAGTDWLGTVPKCSVAVCTFNTTEFAEVHMSADASVAGLSTNVTIKCEEGYSFFVDHTSGQSVTMVTCECVFKNGGATCEVFGDIHYKRCDAVTCPQLAPEYSFHDMETGRNYTYGENITLVCTAGYVHRSAVLSHPPKVTTFCNESGQWDVSSIECKKTGQYKGCYAPGSLQTLLNLTLSAQLYCIYDCRDLDYRYAASANGSCFCGNYLEPTFTVVDPMLCNRECPLIPSDQHNTYCGGLNHEESIYRTITTNCYKEVNMTGIPSFPVSGDKTLTCKQRCLADFAFYSILTNGQCSCTNSSSFQGSVVAHSCSSLPGFNGILYTITQLNDLTLDYESCDKLYEAGVKDNGYYNLKVLGRTYCNFKDGTICPHGWIGFAGDCYLFQKGNFTFVNAMKYCQQLNGTVASILTSVQNDFVTSTIQGFDEFRGSTTLMKKWFIGLYDPKAIAAYSWTDGNLLTYQNFADLEPLAGELTCVALYQDNGKWYSHSCGTETNTICKYGGESLTCVYDDINSTVWNSTFDDMTLTMCTQACLARGTSYSLARNDTCYCVEGISNTSVMSYSNCDIGCPGNILQTCGGNTAGYFTAVDLRNASRASTCEDLQSQGLTGDRYKLEGSNNYTVCNDTGCPYAWIKGNSSCYKLLLGRKNYADALQSCANYSSHLLVVNSVEDDEFISGVIGNLTFYSSAPEWTFGLHMTGFYTKRYFWANGQRSNPTVKDIISSGTGRLKRGLFLSPSMIWKMGGKTSERSYICEQSNVFHGCYLWSNVSVAVIENDAYMTVQQCVESCRGNGYLFAMVQKTACFCEHLPPLDKDGGAICSDTCVGVQSCGSTIDDAVSVYKTWLYPLSNTCEDLYDRGVIRSGTYSINGIATTCNFYDNTTCPTSDWLGYRGKCYMFVDQALDQSQLYSHCDNLGGHLLTITSESEHDFFRMILKGHPKYAHTTIRLGLVDEFGLGTFTWATGSLPSYSPPLSSNPSQNSVVMELTNDADYNYVTSDEDTTTYSFCELKRQYLGCFTTPGSIQPIISKYENMDLTLCKQTCMGNVSMDGVALVQRTACYCTELPIPTAATTSASCNVTCPGNSLQVCGGDDVVNAYSLEYSDVAQNCSSLYKAGVWRKGTYLIGNTTQECGETMIDDTLCPKGWFGKHGACYQFASTVGMSYTDAEQTCFNNGGYLFYPSSTGKRQMFKDLYPYISVTTDGIWTSVKDELLTSFKRTGDGSVFGELASSNDQIYSVFNMTTGLMESYSNGSFAVICERSEGYVGCKQVNRISATVLPIYLRYDITATQCIQYCLSSNLAVYAIVWNTWCYCFDETSVSFNESYVDSCESCVGYSAQPCGSKVLNGVESVFKLSYYATNLAASCAQMVDSGVSMYGRYNIRPPNNNPITVTCFWEVFHFIDVPGNLITASSYEAPFIPSLIRGTELLSIFSPDTVWIPAEGDTEPWVQLELSNDYLVTGMLVQGRPNPSTNQFTKTVEVRYTSLVDKEWKSIGSFLANKDKASAINIFFPAPFVTKTVRVYPDGTSVALRMGLFGNHMAMLDYSSTYMGCYAVFNTSSPDVTLTVSVVSEADCVVTCAGTVPFYSYDALLAECRCHEKMSYGQLPQSDCDNAEPFAAAVHRLYAVSCDPPGAVPGSTNLTTFAHVPDVFTVSSTISYTCDAGHEFFLDNTTSRNITCGDNHVWDSDLGDYCRVISCPELDFPNGTVNTTATTYKTVVLLTCNTGYTMSGATSMPIICQADKTWNSSAITCQAVDCGTPPSMANTELTDKGHTYGLNATYTCPSPMRFAPDTYSLTSSCGADGKWEPIMAVCTRYRCGDPPDVRNAISAVDNTTATYSCVSHYQFPGGSSVKAITCNSSFIWESIPDCIYNGTLVTKKLAEISFVDTKLRQNNSSLLDVIRGDSTIDCSDRCLRNSLCQAFNYNKQLTDANCKLFTETSDTDIFLVSTDWMYFEVNDIELFP
ncbi:uncharacterized protein [Argopecten irradians]|uniref:uncharacterized protein n=1 Tax=Argopecten irradians TaxID=31199 RepID=UPI0037209CBA